MRNSITLLMALFSILGGTYIVSAQDVYISIPSYNIINRSEYVRVEYVMNTQGNRSWRADPWKEPKIRSTTGDRFMHTKKPNTFLPSSVLHWRIDNISGRKPPFNKRDSWPSYQWFTSSYQAWYTPFSSDDRYSAGDIEFSFRIPSSEFASNAFYAGKYKIGVEQSYASNSGDRIVFSPEQFDIYLDVSEAIEWFIRPNHKVYEVSSLNEFRPGNSKTIIDLGKVEVGHTIDFDFYTKAKKIKFKSLNGSNRNLDIGLIKLGSTHPKITSLPLDRNRKNHTKNNSFTVEPGNRTAFDIRLYISKEDFKTHFFEAGTYRFELEIGARGVTDSKKSKKDVEVSIVVPALSEIIMPSGDGEVTFVFNNMVQYNEGQSKTIPNQLRISNNENYELYVKSGKNYFTSNGLESNIDASILEIGVEGHSEKVKLSTKSKKIIKNGIPGVDQNLNLIYSISPTAAKTLIPKEKKSYAINVIYSFTAI